MEKHLFLYRKIQLIFTILFLVIMFGSSCKKFLDVRPNSKQVKFSIKDCQAVLDDYNTMNINYSSEAETSADNYYLTDATYNSLSNIDDRNIYVWAPQAQRLSTPTQYTSPYKVVYNANLVIDVIDNGDKGNYNQETINSLKGAALFFRAYAHFHVAQIYAKPYDAATASQDLGIPIRLSPNIEDKSFRGSVQQNYDLIIKDLLEAINLLPITSSIQSRPNKVAAYAELARVYLAMADYPNAGVMANNALQLYSTLIDYNTISTTSTTPFARFNSEVIFQSVAVSSSPILPNNAKIDSLLYKSYDNSDLRKKIFFKQNTGVNLNTYKFTGSYEPTTTLATFFSGLATDELYLIRAESYARAGNVGAALDDLNTLMRKRWSGPFTNITAANADEVLSKVLVERRKELVFRYLRWSDLRRLNKESRFQKTLARKIAGNIYELPPNDLRYTLLIPKAIIDATGFPQNPR